MLDINGIEIQPGMRIARVLKSSGKIDEVGIIVRKTAKNKLIMRIDITYRYGMIFENQDSCNEVALNERFNYKILESN